MLITTILALVGAIALLVALLITYFVMMALGASLIWFFGVGIGIELAAQALFWSTIVPLIISIGIMLVFDILIYCLH